MTDYAAQIHKALYPRWLYTGGYIIANVAPDGSRVTLIGYADPDQEESEILIRKVEAILGVKPYWQRIGSSNPPVPLPLEKVIYQNLQEPNNEAEQDIHALVKFIADTQNAIQNKATVG